MPAAGDLHGQLGAEPQPGLPELRVVGVERDVAEVVAVQRVHAQLALADHRDGQLERAQALDRERLADARQRRSRGERGCDWGEDVAAVERRRDRLQAFGRATDLDGLERASEPLQREREQAVVGADEQLVRGGGTHGDRPPGVCSDGADLGVDDREVHAGGMYGRAPASVRAPARMSWRGIAWVMSITRAAGQRRAITPWQTPTNSSSSP